MASKIPTTAEKVVIQGAAFFLFEVGGRWVIRDEAGKEVAKSRSKDKLLGMADKANAVVEEPKPVDVSEYPMPTNTQAVKTAARKGKKPTMRLTPAGVKSLTGKDVDEGCLQYVNDNLANKDASAYKDAEYVTELVTEFQAEPETEEDAVKVIGAAAPNLLTEEDKKVLKGRKAKQPKADDLDTEIAKREKEQAESDVKSEVVVPGLAEAQAKIKAKKPVSPPAPSTPKVKTSSKPKAQPVTQKRPGVLAKMVECLEAASEKSPVTKESILEVLVKAFPDREEAKMKSTLSMQMPSGLRTEKKIILGSKTLPEGRKGYWIDKKATKEFQAK